MKRIDELTRSVLTNAWVARKEKGRSQPVKTDSAKASLCLVDVGGGKPEGTREDGFKNGRGGSDPRGLDRGPPVRTAPVSASKK